MSEIHFFRNKLFIILILIWPYIFLFPHTFGFLVMGNDFDLIYFSYKRYIAEMLSEGIIPLWSPFDGNGFSLIFNPFAQYFYIPGWILYLIHFITKNLSLHTFLLYTIFAISIFSLGIFYWLKSLKIDQITAFFSALVIACSLKVTELLRFPNAAHAAAWIPWTLYGINLMISGNKKKSFFIIFFSNFFILTAGYPYFIIYSLFLFFPYIIFIPFLFNNSYFFSFNSINIRFYFSILIPFVLSYLIALPWLLKVRKTMSGLVDRTEKNWDFATEHTFYWKDTIGSWIFPPASSAEGWYYSSIIITFIVFFGLLIFFSKSKKVNYFDKNIFIFSLLFILFITFFSWGKHSPIFVWSWENLPLIGSLRTWPRINIIIIPIIILLFSISLKYFLIYLKENTKKDLKKIILYFIIIFIFFLTLQILFFLLGFQNEEYWNFWQKKRFDEAINLSPTILGNFLKLYDGPIYMFFNLLSVIFLIIFLINDKLKDNLKLFYTVLILLVTAELFVLSNLQWSLPEWKTKFYKTENSLQKLQNAFHSKRIIDTVKGNEYFRDNRRFNVNYPDNYGYNNHAKNYSYYFQRYGGIKNENISDNEIRLVKLFYGATDEAKKIFLSQSIDHKNIVSFINDSNVFEKSNDISIKIFINEYDGNNLRLEISSEKNGWLSFIDNWDHGWVATVNGEKTQIYKLLESYKSIKIKKGFSKVKFQYKPW